MASTARQPQLDPDVLALLARLRRRIRRYVWTEGIGYSLALLLAGFWLSLAVDWLFEPPLLLRLLVQLGVATAVGYVFYRFALSRALVPLTNANMALLIERRFGKFHDSLLTAVELSDQRQRDADHDDAMLAATCTAAREALADVDLDEIFDPAPLTRAVSAALLLAVTVLIFALTATPELGVWTRRNLLLSEELWPRKTHLTIEGFEGGVAKVARGADLEIVARADTAGVVPHVVQLRFRTDEGTRGWANMTRLGQADPARDPYQQFTHRFQSILSPLRFDVVGGDDRLRDLRVEVVESPSLSEMELDVAFPSYTGRPARTLPVTGLMQIPQGSQVVVKARANKHLVEVSIEEPAPSGPPAVHRLHLSERDRRAFEFPLGRLDADRTLLFSLLDEDGIRNREPLRLALAAVRDEAPQLAVRLHGIGSAVTPQAHIPWRGTVTDDYGVARLWLEAIVDQGEPRVLDLGLQPAGQLEVSVDRTFEVRELDLQPGQQLTLALRAEDTFGLDEGPNTASSDRFQLDVVTPEDLRAMLESRELNLRRRFERIIEEVTETRNSLAHIDFDEADAPSAEASADDDLAARVDPVELRRLQAERALQNTRKSASETRGVGAGFDDIHDELVNNRIDTDELKSRLKQSIADPLRTMADERFARLAELIGQLQDQSDDPAAGHATLASAVRQSDALLVEMQQVLARMLELETFNEVVAMLRAIVEEQDTLREATQQQRRQKVRQLLED